MILFSLLPRDKSAFAIDYRANPQWKTPCKARSWRDLEPINELQTSRRLFRLWEQRGGLYSTEDSIIVGFDSMRQFCVYFVLKPLLRWLYWGGKKMGQSIHNSNFSYLQMAGCTLCPVQWEQRSPAQWRLWPETASPLPPSTPASLSSSPLTSQCATHITAPCPTAHPRTTSSSTSAWAGRRRAHGNGHDPRASCVRFLLSVNAGQHTGLEHFLSAEAPKSWSYCWFVFGYIWTCWWWSFIDYAQQMEFILTIKTFTWI